MNKEHAQPKIWTGLALCAGLLCAFSCGSEFANGDPNTDAGGNTGDGGVNDQCDLAVVAPALASIGQEIELAVEVLPAGLIGLREFQWTVNLQGVAQPLTPLADPLDRVSFVPTAAGPYQVEVQGSVGVLDCRTSLADITVIADGALSEDYRMRVAPLSGAPTQDFQVRIYGGADSALPATQMESGLVANGTLTDALGAGVPAYLRARKRGTLAPADYEAFSDASGSFALRLPTGRFDLLAVPSGGGLPSVFLQDVEISDIAQTIVIPAPVSLSGDVKTAGGVPVAGARVSLVVDGAPSTSVLSAADGTFTVLGHSGSLSGLTVAPAAGSGMPALRAEGLSGQAVDGASPVSIQYASPAVNAQVDLSLVGGGAAVGARVEWRAESAQAATVNVNVGAPEDVAGVMRVTATADGTGRAQASVAAVVADLVVESSDASEGLVVPALDWGASPSTVRSLEALVPVSFSVSFAAAAAAGAKILAVPIGALAPQSAAAAATIPISGTASLSLVSGGDYQVLALDKKFGSQFISVSDVGLGTLVPQIELPGTIMASGYVSIDGNAAAGARVTLYCDGCSGDEATRVRAMAVADAAGRYNLQVADPGIATP
jgi:hypothetical protein